MHQLTVYITICLCLYYTWYIHNVQTRSNQKGNLCVVHGTNNCCILTIPEISDFFQELFTDSAVLNVFMLYTFKNVPNFYSCLTNGCVRIALLSHHAFHDNNKKSIWTERQNGFFTAVVRTNSVFFSWKDEANWLQFHALYTIIIFGVVRLWMSSNSCNSHGM